MERICPICGKKYDEYPALSRKDNETEICPECGVKEALDDYLGASLYEELMEMLDGHSWAFCKNDNDEAVVITAEHGYVKTQIAQNNGRLRTNVYWSDGTTEEYYSE